MGLLECDPSEWPVTAWPTELKLEILHRAQDAWMPRTEKESSYWRETNEASKLLADNPELHRLFETGQNGEQVPEEQVLKEWLANRNLLPDVQ